MEAQATIEKLWAQTSGHNIGVRLKNNRQPKDK